jgi:parallel beta-helix repeat protein
VTDPLLSGISIEAENVALDLNGFVITGAGSGFPRGVISLEDNVSVSNGTVRSMYNGLHLQGEGARVERMYLLGNIAAGALVGAGATVSNNTITGNGSSGISAQASCLITHNSIRDGGSHGISTGSGCTVTGNTLSDNAGFGVNFNSAFSGYGDNVLTGNNGGSANDQVKFGAEIGTNICGFDTVCP